jgi:hypothetical protein
MSEQREDLERLRIELFAALTDADVAVKAQIAGQLRAVVKDLAALGAPAVEVTKADEIAARRAARRSGADNPASTARRSQPRGRRGSDRTG